MAIRIKAPDEIEKMRKSCGILAEIMGELWDEVEVGTNTWELNELAIQKCNERGVRPAFLGYEAAGKKFPAAICACVNEVVVHGVPSKDLNVGDGDVFTIDMGVEIDGWMSDMAVSKVVGDGDEVCERVVEAADKALSAAIKMCRPGKKLKQISDAIKTTSEKSDCRPMVEFVGHGIGQELHEDPQIPGHWIEGAFDNITLKKGMVFAIEAIITSGKRIESQTSNQDGWSAWPLDKALTACSEKTVAVADSPDILTK